VKTVIFEGIGQLVFLKYLIFLLLKIKYFLYILNCFDVLISKIILKKIKNKNHFKKQPQLHF
jgi:hypothetical protein